jgi:hypothetical protein
MISDEKMQEIKKALRKGEPEGEVREQLKREGFSEEDIRSVFKPHHYDMRSWYLIFGTLVSLAGVVILFRTNGFLVLILGLLLFYAYYLETKRLKQQK